MLGPRTDSSPATQCQAYGVAQSSLRRTRSSSTSGLSSQSSSDISISMTLKPRLKFYPEDFAPAIHELISFQKKPKETQEYDTPNDTPNDPQEIKQYAPLPENNNLEGVVLNPAMSGRQVLRAIKNNQLISSHISVPIEISDRPTLTPKFVAHNDSIVQNLDVSESAASYGQALTSKLLPNAQYFQCENSKEKCRDPCDFSAVPIKTLQSQLTEKNTILESRSGTETSRISTHPEFSSQKIKIYERSTLPFTAAASLAGDAKKQSQRVTTQSQTEIQDKPTTVHLENESITLSSSSKPFPNPSVESKNQISLIFKVEPPGHFGDAANNYRGKEKVRATQGADPALEHIDFSGARIPPPCDWEVSRPKFDSSGFMNIYINEWIESKGPDPEITGFTTDRGWLSGDYHVDGPTLRPRIVHAETKPTIGETSEIEKKHQHQTSYQVILCENIKRNKILAMRGRLEKKNHDLPSETFYTPNEFNTFSPRIPMYLRPAKENDSEQVAKIYNKHVAEGNITEDQEPISAEDALHLIDHSKKEKLPFIVAVAGNTATIVDAQLRQTQQQNDTMPRTEKIIGFAFNERYNYGFSGSTKGRSRYTTTLQLFVDHEYQRKGVGRNLLDRLIHMLSTAYGYKKSCEFLNPDGDKVYESEGSGKWHQLQLHVPVLKKDDPDFPGIKEFLFSNFLIGEFYRLKSTGRTNFLRGPAKWLDTAVFQLETSQEGNFDPFC